MNEFDGIVDNCCYAKCSTRFTLIAMLFTLLQKKRPEIIRANTHILQINNKPAENF
jgi:hypothetical protein